MTDYYVDEDYEDAFDEGELDEYSGEELLDDVEQQGPTEIEGRTSWMYLGVLLALFVLLVFFSWACNDRSDTPGEPITDESADVAAGTAARLTISVDGDVVIVSGSVPDEAARQQILLATQEQYGPENVIDELVVDETTTLDGGSFSITGSAPFDDERPQALRQAIASGFGLAEGNFAIDRGEGTVDAVTLEGQLDGETLTLVGGVPDQQSITELVAAGEAIWGPGSVDTDGLTISDSTWTDGSIRVTGTVGPGDDRVESFPVEIQTRLGALVVVDISEVSADLSAEALTEIEEELAELVLADPITFAPLSAELTPDSEAILSTVAETLNTIPDVSVEVVGHTDNAGAEDENQALSLERAEAVVARLTELGVDAARLTARGEGESSPLVSNDTPAGREQNRRIEFTLVGSG